MAFANKHPAKTAIWALTPDGAGLALKIADLLPGGVLFFSERLADACLTGADANVICFARLKDAVAENFWDYPAHIFIMSTGIAVRMIAPLIEHKTHDPAVLAADEKGLHIISLLSGHLGGANALTLKVAKLIRADPVLTTATDIQGVPAIDLLAQEKNLIIENPDAIKYVSMALLTDEPITIHDPYRMLHYDLKSVANVEHPIPNIKQFSGVFVDDICQNLSEKILILRPASLVAGIGCNRNTSLDEIRMQLSDVLERFKLSQMSLKCLASIDVKADEKGLLALAEELNRPLVFFNREELNAVKTIENPSAVVEKYVGVKSVCEAAAILGANQGQLIAPKQKTPNVTVAIARIPFISSESAPAAANI
ncbi:cobalt-precorrin 5A hydrolase [Desulfococcaceae bacterium HSG9]|nr:cobalt-precorrin 5A hydrolase [Desulfococcaceae bacterium HSG9]